MANEIKTTVREGQDIEGRVILSCEVWETEGSENYAEVVYSSYKDSYEVVFGIITEEMYAVAVAAMEAHCKEAGI